MALTYEPIFTTTLGSATSAFDISSIPTTYTDLIFVGTGVVSADGVALRFRFNGDNGSNYSYNYMSGGGAGAGGGRTNNATFLQLTNWYLAAQSSISFQILNYKSSSVNKIGLVRNPINNVDTNAMATLWRSNAAINQINVFTSSGTISQNATFTLYGIKAA